MKNMEIDLEAEPPSIEEISELRGLSEQIFMYAHQRAQGVADRTLVISILSLIIIVAIEIFMGANFVNFGVTFGISCVVLFILWTLEEDIKTKAETIFSFTAWGVVLSPPLLAAFFSDILPTMESIGGVPLDTIVNYGNYQGSLISIIILRVVLEGFIVVILGYMVWSIWVDTPRETSQHFLESLKIMSPAKYSDEIINISRWANTDKVIQNYLKKVSLSGRGIIYAEFEAAQKWIEGTKDRESI